MKNKIGKLTLAGMLAGALTTSQIAKANDIVIGTRGPTEWQMDIKAGYNEKEDAKGNVTRTVTQNDVLKYWNTMIKGDMGEAGVWAFCNVPAYKSVDNGKSQDSGFGDLMFGAGPRGSFNIGNGSLHVLTQGGAILPTGDMEKGKPSLTGDRTDTFAGMFLTWFPDAKKKMEIDLTAQYTFAGENSLGVKGQDSISGGLIAGGRVFDNKMLEIRLAGGINGSMNTLGNYSYGPRGVIRFTPKFKSGKKWGHLEVIGDYDSSAKNMSKGYGVMTQVRVNF
ncbi:MAG: transporter [Nanoarchaeota archaeon]